MDQSRPKFLYAKKYTTAGAGGADCYELWILVFYTLIVANYINILCSLLRLCHCFDIIRLISIISSQLFSAHIMTPN